MKRVVLLSVVALLLAASVFAPTASAKQPQLGDVRVESATLQSDATVLVTGTI